MFGGADGIRTHDLLDAIEARSQLRHGPTAGILKILSQDEAMLINWPVFLHEKNLSVTPITFFHPFSTYPAVEIRNGLPVFFRFRSVRCLF